MIRLSIFSLSAALFVTLALGAAACAKSNADSGGDGTSDTDGGSGAEGGLFGGEGGTVDPAAACSSDNKDVFVIGEDRTLYSFHPPTVTFTPKGMIDCPTGGATPTSMAVDRSGTAWVRHSDGTVWKVSTETLACEATTFTPQSAAFMKFGMGFSTESKGGSTETLYLSDSLGAGIAKLNTKTFKIDYLGAATGDLAGTPSELTGTGDGKLYGFFITQPATLAEISKVSGDVIANTAHTLTGVFAGDAWAFSFYGGDFFIYTTSNGGSNLPMNQLGSDVTKYSPSDGSITVVKHATGFKIVGAGVSTCAPTTAVK